MSTKYTIGIIREEGRTPPDKRTPLTPDQCRLLQEKYPDVQVLVQPSKVRCFSDEDYKKQGIKLSEDLSGCDTIFGIKEVPVKNLIPEKTYFFFSHTLKKQPHNKGLLQAILAKKIRMIDYEVITDDAGNRLIAFGFFAGVIGAYNGLLTYGKRYKTFDLKPAWAALDMTELEREYSKIKLPGARIAVTGGGRVAQGAMHVLDKLRIRKVTPRDYLELDFNEPVYTQLNSSDYHRHKDQMMFDRDDFHHNPHTYYSYFSDYAFRSDILIAGAYWDPRAPKLFSLEQARQAGFRLRIVADVTCDINGSIPFTVKSTTIDDPVFDFDPYGETVEPPYSDPENVTVMAVDNLPCELPRDSSRYFGDRLINNILPDLLGGNASKILDRATMTKNGQLTERFSYLQDYVA